MLNTPPRSPYDLIQEQIYADPWRVFVACIFCNLTQRRKSEPIMWKFWELYPDAHHAEKAQFNDVYELVKDLGLGKRRAETLIRMSRDYITKDWPENPKILPGVGDYAYDAYRIFCLSQWSVIPEPRDGALKNYWKWVNKQEEMCDARGA